LYRNGFYLHKQSEFVKGKEKKQDLVPLPDLGTKHIEEPIIASTDNKLILLPKKFFFDSLKNVCNDSLWTKDGVVTRVKVIEVNEKEIRYKRCSNPDGPTFVSLRSSVSKIKYANGFVETYNEEKVKEIEIQKPVENKNNQKLKDVGTPALISVAAFVFFGIMTLLLLSLRSLGFLLFLFILSGVAAYFATWITSLSALIKIKRHPDKYKGQGKAITGLVIVGVYTLLCLAILALVLMWR
jgi:hypothetical protein